MRKFLPLIAILSFITTNTFAHDEAKHSADANATYLGNEGVLIARGETKILFDAFYAQSYGQYALVPDEIASAMMNGEAPYDGIDAIFVSHVHGDHFTAAPAIAYMRAHKTVTLYGSTQVLAAIKDAGIKAGDPLLSRIKAFDLSPDDKAIAFDVDGLSVDVVAIPHAGNRPTIQNFSWRVTLDDNTTVMHMGDAGVVRADFERHKDHFAAKKTHAAFPPYWFIGDTKGEAILNDYINADQTIGVHVPARASGKGDDWRTQAGGDLFTDPGETREIKGDQAN